MYSSLDRADMIVKDAGGSNVVIQTDHRTAAEVESEGDLSTVFATVRVLNGARMGMQQGGPHTVQYASSQRPPRFLHDAIAAAGGVLTVDHQEVPYPGRPPAMVDVLNGAIIRLARTLSYRFDRDLTLEGLRDVERQYYQSGPDHEGDEIAYWTSVVELGAFGGEVLRGFRGGRWNVTQHDMGTLPIAFEVGPMVVNPMGKAIKFLDAGEEDSLAYMVQVSVAELDHSGHSAMPPPQGGPARPEKRRGLLGGLLGKR